MTKADQSSFPDGKLCMRAKKCSDLPVLKYAYQDPSVFASKTPKCSMICFAHNKPPVEPAVIRLLSATDCSSLFLSLPPFHITFQSFFVLMHFPDLLILCTNIPPYFDLSPLPPHEHNTTRENIVRKHFPVPLLS